MGVKLKTVKALFSNSGNRCAFPDCKIKLVNKEQIVIGEICHIKAQSDGGPRFDENQTEEERHDYNNLILLCPTHHKLIDSDVNTYKVEVINKFKSEHEENFTAIPEELILDILIEKIINTSGLFLFKDSNVVNINSPGSYTIVNQNIVENKSEIPESIVEISQHVSSKEKPLSWCTTALLSYATKNKLNELEDLCRIELNGVRLENIQSTLLKHRKVDVFVSPIKVDSVHSMFGTISDIATEFRKHDYFEETKYVYPFSLVHIEQTINKFGEQSRDRFYIMTQNASDFEGAHANPDFNFDVYIYFLDEVHITVYENIRQNLLKYCTSLI